MLQHWLYVGGFVKFIDMYYTTSEIHNFSIIPYITVGYWFEISDQFIIDIRLNQTLMAVSFSTAEHTGVGVAPMFSPLKSLTPILPLFVINFGFSLD